MDGGGLLCWGCDRAGAPGRERGREGQSGPGRAGPGGKFVLHLSFKLETISSR